MNRFRQFAGLVLPGIVLSSVLSASPAMPGAVLAAAANDSAVQAAGQIRFTYENPNLEPAKYVLILKENGTGHYNSELGTAPSGDEQAWPTRPQDRQITISGRTREALFSAARQAKYFAGSCEDVGAKVAFQGKKTLEYQGADGQGSCNFNWSTSKYIQLITEKCQGIALTLEEGRKLEMQHAHARLSLEPELETLDRLAKAGNALELGNIVPVLTDIAADNAVLEHARRQARTLLDMAKREQ